jgi:predicted PurR-regulated permease PerM
VGPKLRITLTLEILVKKFNANLADLENLSTALSQEVRSGIRSASKALSDVVKDEVQASVQQTINTLAEVWSTAVQKNIKLMNDYEILAFSMNIKWMMLSLVSAAVVAIVVLLFFKRHINHLPCFNQCICEMSEPKDVEKKKDIAAKK